MENICRTCLRSPEKLYSLTEDIGLTYKIETISSVQLSDNIKFPSTICGECITNVNKLFNFRKVIINSDKEIRERYAALQRSNFNNKQTNKTVETREILHQSSVVETQGKDTVTDGVKWELQHESESMDDKGSEARDSDIETDTEVSNETNPMDSVKKALATLKICKCNICDKTFPSRFKLNKHKQNVHVAQGICNICGATIRTDNLSRHVQMHSEDPVECKQCGKVFKNTGSLRGHLLLHRGLTFTCEICGNISKIKKDYTRHMKLHEDPDRRKVVCKICGKKVRTIKTHMNSHTGERPYLCSYCNKGFTSSYSLKIHTRLHTNEKPYLCEYCTMAFPQKMSLTAHIKSKHNVQVSIATTRDTEYKDTEAGEEDKSPE